MGSLRRCIGNAGQGLFLIGEPFSLQIQQRFCAIKDPLGKPV